MDLPLSFTVRPAYAKIRMAFCFVVGPDGNTAMVELPVPSEIMSWSSEEIALRAALRAAELRATRKQKENAVKGFKKDHPCPATNTTGKCKGYYVDFVVPLEDGSANSALNLEWKRL